MLPLQPGHNSGSCNTAPHCSICAAAGEPTDHRSGSKACDPPARNKDKGRVKTSVATVIVAIAAATAADASNNAVVAAVAIMARLL